MMIDCDKNMIVHLLRNWHPNRLRLGQLGLRIERLPGGHLPANEQPDALAALITNFERGFQKTPRDASSRRC
jgi:hypothetical protein